MCASISFGTWCYFVLYTLPHISSCLNTQLWDGTAHTFSHFLERVASLKEWNGGAAILSPPVLGIYFWEDYASLIYLNFKMEGDLEKACFYISVELHWLRS